MILSKVADPTYRSCYPQDAEWSQVHQGRVLVALGVWASAQPADVRRFPHVMPWWPAPGGAHLAAHDTTAVAEER